MPRLLYFSGYGLLKNTRTLRDLQFEMFFFHHPNLRRRKIKNKAMKKNLFIFISIKLL